MMLFSTGCWLANNIISRSIGGAALEWDDCRRQCDNHPPNLLCARKGWSRDRGIHHATCTAHHIKMISFSKAWRARSRSLSRYRLSTFSRAQGVPAQKLQTGTDARVAGEAADVRVTLVEIGPLISPGIRTPGWAGTMECVSSMGSRNVRAWNSIGPFSVSAYPWNATAGIGEAHRRIGGAWITFHGRRAGITARVISVSLLCPHVAGSCAVSPTRPPSPDARGERPQAVMPRMRQAPMASIWARRAHDRLNRTIVAFVSRLRIS